MAEKKTTKTEGKQDKKTAKKPFDKLKAKRLILLDAHAIIHRSYHALPDFSASDGRPTGALYGLSLMLLKIIKDLKPDYLVACYDLPQKTFRHEAYDGYKAGRAKADDSLVAQINTSRDVFTAFGIPIYEMPGYEADDILGTIVTLLKSDKEVDIIIASGDMDTMQLIDGKKVQVYTLKKGLQDTILYDEDAVVARYGFKPTSIADYKGLRGDTSDNIIGIAGIGEKTGTTIIQAYETIEQLYKALKKDKKKVQETLGVSDRMLELLVEGEEEAMFSKTLATIKCDVPIDFELPHDVWQKHVKPTDIETLFKQLEFRSLITRLKDIGDGLDQTEKIIEKVDAHELETTGIALWLTNSDLTAPTYEKILEATNSENFADAKKKVFAKLDAMGLREVYGEIELPIVPMIHTMSDYGVLVDRKAIEALRKELVAKLDMLTEKIFALSGHPFNINSPKQVGEVLFDELHLELPGKRNAKRSTRASVLDELASSHEIVAYMLEYREAQKLLSTYVDAVPDKLDKHDRLHATFVQHGTTTGRFSSEQPNLQNIPIKSEFGRRFRSVFIASPGTKLVAFDYSQIELRALGILANDEELISIFKNGKDIHTNVAAKVFGVTEENVTSDMRRKAKVINFGILYGMGSNALAKNLGTSRAEAEDYIGAYFATFRGAARYMEETKQFARTNGYTKTLFGRRRYLKDINSRLPFLRANAERMAGNAPIQGTEADIIKLAIRFADEDIKKAGLDKKVHLVLQIHDELVYEIEDNAIKQATEVITEALDGVLERSCLKLKSEVPLAVHAGAGLNLNEVK